MCSITRGSALCPDEEGIKTRQPLECRTIRPVQHSALTKKGLRPPRSIAVREHDDQVQHSALTKKGLRPVVAMTHWVRGCSALCPDEEGIKTPSPGTFRPRRRGSALCPDEEGIKTTSARPAPAPRWVQHSALTKKGLRPNIHHKLNRQLGFSTLP